MVNRIKLLIVKVTKHKGLNFKLLLLPIVLAEMPLKHEGYQSGKTITRAFVPFMRIPLLFVLLVGLGLLVSGAQACRPAPPSQAAPTELIRFERTACMGPCPVDVLTVFTDGRLRYEGEQHGPRTGIYTGQLSAEEQAALLREFEAARFFDFAPAYKSRATDLPTYYLTFSAGGRSHRVEDYDHAPATLKALEASLEKLIAADRWQRQSESARPPLR
jgi:hypothetical protein